MTCTHCRQLLDTRHSTFETRDDRGHRRFWCSLACIYQHQHINDPLDEGIST